MRSRRITGFRSSSGAGAQLVGGTHRAGHAALRVWTCHRSVVLGLLLFLGREVLELGVPAIVGGPCC